MVISRDVLQWILDNADDSGYPVEQAVSKFELSDEESDILHEFFK